MRKFIRKGFTLIEMAVVLVLLGILAALAVPTFSALITSAEEDTAAATLEGIDRCVAGLAALDNTAATTAHYTTCVGETGGAATYDAGTSTVTIIVGGSTETFSRP